MSRDKRLLLDGNPKGYEVAEHTATKYKRNPRMLSTLKNEKYIWSINLVENFDTSMLVTLVILVALLKIQIEKGSSKSVKFIGRPFMIPFFEFFII